MASGKKDAIRIEQYRSAIGRPKKQRDMLNSLGLRRIRHVVEREDSPAVRSMLRQISHLVREVEQ